MQYLRILFFFCIPFCASQWANGQNSFKITEVGQLSNFVDTIEIKRNHARVLMTWLNDTIEISSLVHPVKYDLVGMRKFLKDSTFLPTPEEEEKSKDFVKTASQNCFSYALQKYFTYNTITPDLVFNKNTALTKQAFETIVEKTFTSTSEFSTKNKRHFKDSIADGTLIVFRNKYNWIIHAFYYEKGLFYSKNGGWAAKEYKKMKDLFKIYWDTELVQFYEMNKQKYKDFVQNKM